MFELSKELDIKVASDIGPNKKNAVVIDNFYANPDEVRNLCLQSKQITSEDNPGLIGNLPGNRVFIETEEVSKNLKNLFLMICSDFYLWQRPFNVTAFNSKWDGMGFMCNVINDSTLLNNPSGITPHQDSYPGEHIALDTQFGSVIYLNTPEECTGGTNIYSFDGRTTLPYGSDIEQQCGKSFDDINSGLKKYPWKVEHEFEMIYNRCILYEADILHGQNVDLGMFVEYDRINQTLFM
tara:strand:- start:213 stop:926 length:714 start_codon:yes stop_codon:yes gene_type:complete